MSRRDALRLMAAVGAGGVLGCTPRRAGAEPVIAGEEECAYCRMLIDETSLAAQVIPSGGPRVVFGEIGCMLAWLAQASRPEGMAWVWVPEPGVWFEAQRGRYSIGETRTPMRFDIVALGAAHAESVSWESLRQKGVPDVRTS